MKQAKWILYEDLEINAWQCSECEHVQYYNDGTPFENHAHYCPSCGAYMTAEVAQSELNHDKIQTTKTITNTNPNLIEAAPEMYELLKTICSYNISGASFKVWAARGEARKLLERIDGGIESC